MQQILGISFRNPVLTASGTFGYGIEFEKQVDLNQLGAIIVKGLSREPIDGNAAPRLWGVHAARQSLRPARPRPTNPDAALRGRLRWARRPRHQANRSPYGASGRARREDTSDWNWRDCNGGRRRRVSPGRREPGRGRHGNI